MSESEFEKRRRLVMLKERLNVASKILVASMTDRTDVVTSQDIREVVSYAIGKLSVDIFMVEMDLKSQKETP